MNERGFVTGFVLVLVLVLGSLGCGPAERQTTLPDDQELTTLFRDLHQSVYRVYEFGTDRDAIHDLLARSFSGEALTQQYVEHFTTLVRMQREKTSIRVVRVDYEEVRVLPGRSGLTQDSGGQLSIDADWSVGGIVSHQSHQHLRTNRYRAIYDLAETPDGWRIVATRLRDLRRVETGLGMSTTLPTSAGGLMSPLELLRAGVGEPAPSAEPDPSAEPGPSAASEEGPAEEAPSAAEGEERPEN